MLASEPRQLDTPELGLLDYDLARSRRRSLSLQVKNARLKVFIPYYCSLSQAETFIRQKLDWIGRHITAQQEQKKIQSTLVWDLGSSIPYLGAKLYLQCGDNIVCENNVLFLPKGTKDTLKQQAQRWLQQQAITYFTPHVYKLSAQLGFKQEEVYVKLSNAKKQWGSCSNSNVIRLNWRLMHLAPELIFYTIAHEVAHLKEMNHSKAFWRTVAQLDNDYVEHDRSFKSISISSFF